MKPQVLKLIILLSLLSYIAAIDLSLVLGSTHWSPCYSVNKSRPSLLEGADLITSMGSKVFKGPLFAPKNNYPWNSPLWPADNSYASLTDVVKHQYFDELFRNSKLKVFHFDLYRLKSPEELFELGFDEYISSGNYLFIEWPNFADAAGTIIQLAFIGFRICDEFLNRAHG